MDLTIISLQFVIYFSPYGSEKRSKGCMSRIMPNHPEFRKQNAPIFLIEIAKLSLLPLRRSRGEVPS